MWGRLGGGDIPSGTEAGIENAQSLQAGDGGAVIVEMIGLPPHRPVPVEAQPGKILDDGGLEFGPAAGPVYVFNSQQEPSTSSPGPRPSIQRRTGVAEMEVSGRAGRKTGYERHLDFK
jgi:hypothetical protein